MNIQAIDTEWLLWVNGHHSPLMDSLMWQASEAYTWLPLYVLVLVYLGSVYRSGKTLRGWLPFLAILIAFGLAAGLADYISSGILKPLIQRPRPTHNEAVAPMLHLVNCYTGGWFGFPSSHAANTTAVTLLFALLFGHRKAQFRPLPKALGRLLLALLIGLYWAPNCWSRMYLGVHYPTDLAAGALIGAACALAAFFIWRAFYRKITD